jgi:hypothetical protein
VNPADELRLYTVYARPRDFPGEYVVRESLVHGGGKITQGEIVARGSTLEGVRAQIFALPRGPGLTCLPRMEGDDPVIVEVWI